jgi:hypothetical protein
MSENRELTAYKLPRSWIRLILWGIITLCHAFLAVGEYMTGSRLVWVICRIVIVALFALVTVGEIRQRLEVNAQGVVYCPGLARVFRLTWPEVTRVTHKKGSFWRAEVLTFHPAQGKKLVMPSKPEVYAIVAQYAKIEVE